MKSVISLLFTTLAATLPAFSAAPDLLAYWNFNNLSVPYAQPILGTFSEQAGEDGERFDPTEKKLFSNTSGTVFHSDDIFLDLSEFRTGAQNGGEINKAAWGAFSDTEKARASDDTTTGGSLFLVGRAYDGRAALFRLSSKGYKNLVVTYADRNLTTSPQKNSQTWAYSVDGMTFTDMPDAVFRDDDPKFTECQFSLPEALNNQPVFYLRVTFAIPQVGNCAIDNFSLTGTPVR